MIEEADFENYHSEEPVVKNWFEPESEENFNKRKEQAKSILESIIGSEKMKEKSTSATPTEVVSKYNCLEAEEAEFEVVSSTLKQPKGKNT